MKQILSILLLNLMCLNNTFSQQPDGNPMKFTEAPWIYKGLINEIAGNCNTNHHAIVDFKGKSYFVYHTGALVPDAGSFHRSVCIDELKYNRNGTIKKIVMTSEGLKAVK